MERLGHPVITVPIILFLLLGGMIDIAFYFDWGSMARPTVSALSISNTYPLLPLFSGIIQIVAAVLWMVKNDNSPTLFLVYLLLKASFEFFSLISGNIWLFGSLRDL